MFVSSVGGATNIAQPTCSWHDYLSFGCWRDGIVERKSDGHSSFLGELG